MSTKQYTLSNYVLNYKMVVMVLNKMKIKEKLGNPSYRNMTQTEAKIFLTDQRGLTEFPWFRSFHTFNFGKYFDENKTPYGAIRAAWTSIYPGWYSGRAPHIHVHVYNSAGTSLLVTQIAFPEDISKVVYAQGVYASHGQADTTNAKDNVFSDGVSNEMSVVTGSASAGYVLTHTIFVKA